MLHLNKSMHHQVLSMQGKNPHSAVGDFLAYAAVGKQRGSAGKLLDLR